MDDPKTREREKWIDVATGLYAADFLPILGEIERLATGSVVPTLSTANFEELLKSLKLSPPTISEQVARAMEGVKANIHLIGQSPSAAIAALNASMALVGHANITIDPAILVATGVNHALCPVIDVVVFTEEQSLFKIEMVSSITAEVITRIRNDRHELCKLSPRKFEELIMELFSAMGNEVRQAGKTMTSDGFVDIIFWSKTGVPIIGAVQVKHHDSVHGKTGVDAIQRMEGVMSKHNRQLNLGMVVTNTSFTADAQWMANDSGIYLRLRDEPDIDRWIKGDFSSEEELREFPEEIQLTRHLSIPIKKKVD